MASFSSSSSCNYEVFLSFRGDDTRDNFTSHLFAALYRKKVKTFIDEDLKRGDEISSTILSAIEGSTILIIIFSKNYASSKWCLDELVKIFECKKLNDQIVIPIFYYVQPSEVRKQIGSFGKAFVEHEKRFKKMPEKVKNWRDALAEASYLTGHESMKIRPEAKLVEVIVKDVLKKLEDITITTDFKDLIGINSRIEQVKSLLHIRLQEFRMMVGIWGMGGIGKTTLAEAIFKQVSHYFEGMCFMANVREKSETGDGLERLQKEIFSYLLEENLEKGGPNIPQHTIERLRSMKVFIVLDDVNTLGQLEYLIGGLNQFGPGSRIIVTTRDRSVLDKYGVDNIYKVQELKKNEALQLFSKYAFKLNHCPQDFVGLSETMVDYCKNNPLALKVVGSFFHRKRKLADWKISLHNFKQISNTDIYDVLKISYSELKPEEQSIFLDIACFFEREDKDYVTEILDNPIAHYGLNVLFDKSLITISKCNTSKKHTLQMHDLLREMGREIVRQESVKEPGKRSRLWYHEDIYHILKKNKGTDSIEGIFLNLSKIKELHLSSGVFRKMHNLRLLKFYVPEYISVPAMCSKVHLSKDFDYLSEELRYIHWQGYPLRSLPANFIPENLIELRLPYSKIVQLWEGEMEAPKLKIVDLQHCKSLTSIPNPSQTPNLERIILLCCKKLSRVPSSIQNFNNLGHLCFSRCTSLSCFPSNIHFRAPIIIDFSFCINLSEFPLVSGNIIDLNLAHTSIEEVPSSIGRLTSLRKLNLESCERLSSISTCICKLKSLYWLELSSCSKLERFPEILEQMESLEYISLDATKIKNLPSSMELLTGLTDLKLSYCHELGSLPENLGKLKSLKFVEVYESAISQLPSSIKDLNNLTLVRFCGCRGLVLPPLSGLPNLRELRLLHCDIREIPQDIGCLSSLEILDLGGNNFENLPTSVKQLSRLRELYLNHCNRLQSLPELPQSLAYLYAIECKKLQSLPELPECVEILDALLLEMTEYSIFKRSDAFFWDRIRYDFRRCPKMKEKENGIFEDSQLRIQHMAIASLKQFHFNEKRQTGFDIYLPESVNIPEWMIHRCSGSSITVQMPQNCCNTNFLGFALCAVYGFEEDSYDWPKFFEVKCSYRLKTKTLCTSEDFDATIFSQCSFIESDAVFLGFDPCWNVRVPDGDHDTAVRIDFSVNGFALLNQKWPKVKCCGVCPVYAHRNQTQPNTFTVNMMPPTEEECTQFLKLYNFHDKASTSGTAYDEVEPGPKRFCREQISAS